MMHRGTLVRYLSPRGFGFIELEDGTETFLHISEVRDLERGEPVVGQDLEFRMVNVGCDRTRATHIKRVDDEGAEC